MNQFTSYSSSIGRLELHVSFKVKYYHPVFRIKQIAARCGDIFHKVADKYAIVVKELGFNQTIYI